MIYTNYPINGDTPVCDVIICGGGIAGLTIARQLKLRFPDISLVLLEKGTYPLPECKFKVGESTVEVSGYYLREVLQLHDYFKNNHFTKLGFRYFTGNTAGCFSERPEIGLSGFSPYDSFQIDRIILENDLADMNKLAGIQIITGATVEDIQINSGDNWHEVRYHDDGDNSTKHHRARWVIDASGRRCLLQRKFDLKVKPERVHNAVFFWIKGRIEVDTLVPMDKHRFFERVPYKNRFFSTNHIVSKGYWVWLIPLVSGYTSVGIVTSEEVHPYLSYHTEEKAMEWFWKNEPVLAAEIAKYPWVNFTKLKNYSYSSKQVYAADRWACVGEAGFFADPYYSPSINIQSFSNSMVTNMIGLDIRGQLTEAEVAYCSDYAIRLNDWLCHTIQSTYFYFHLPQLMALKTLWDITVGWSFVMPSMFNSIFLDPVKRKVVQDISNTFISMIYRIDEFFLQWAELSSGKVSFEFIDYLKVPFVRDIYQRNIKRDKSAEEIGQDLLANLQTLEEFAHVIFRMAVADVLPGELHRFPENVWLNIQAISLRPDDWEEKQLFNPASEVRNYHVIQHQLQSLFTNGETTQADGNHTAIPENAFTINF